jgi:hypothetical protein
MIRILYAVLLRLIPAWRARGDHRRGRGESTVDRPAKASITVPRPRVDPRLLAQVWAGAA